MTGRRRSRTFRKLSSVPSPSNCHFKRARFSLYGLRRTTVLRLPLCRTLPFSLIAYLSSRCVSISHTSFYKCVPDDDANDDP